MNQQRRSAVLWLTRQGFQLYVNGGESLLSFSFLPESIKYFDIVDEEKFSNQLELFIKQNYLSGLNIYFIIAPEALIEKKFVKDDEDLVNQFIELVPYELVFSKKLIEEKYVLVSCFNGALYQLIDAIWQKYNSQMKTVVPYFSTGQTKFDPQTALLILKKGDSLKNESMINNQEDEVGELLSDNQPKNQKKSILAVILPIFIVLIIILIFVILNFFNSPITPQHLSQPTTPTTIFIPTPTNLPVEMILPSVFEPPKSSSSAIPEAKPTH